MAKQKRWRSAIVCSGGHCIHSSNMLSDLWEQLWEIPWGSLGKVEIVGECECVIRLTIFPAFITFFQTFRA
jgi:hypothetical protein